MGPETDRTCLESQGVCDRGFNVPRGAQPCFFSLSWSRALERARKRGWEHLGVLEPSDLESWN